MQEEIEKGISDFLDIRLEQYAKKDIYPFHMPGHKRRFFSEVNPYSVDITEIEGFDNLHHAEGILKQAQQRAAELYHSKQTFYLINGSSCGILTAISSAVPFGKKILFARNSHKAAYHAILLRHLEPIYLYPQVTDSGIQGAILPKQVKEVLETQTDIAAIFITSPTYDGVVSDIKRIAEIAHNYKIPLIVDEAHGAHFGFHASFPKSAVQMGADIVIQSLHKTLPAFTQTALLHLNSELISKEKVQSYLGIYESSSPSYVLMGGIERCIRFLTEKKEEVFEQYEKYLQYFYESVQDLRQLHVFQSWEAEKQKERNQLFDWDMGKILIFTEGSGQNGEEVYEKLLRKYRLQMEMCTGSYVTAMTSICDTSEGFQLLSDALHKIDGEILNKEKSKQQVSIRDLYKKREQVIPLFEAQEREDAKQVLLSEAAGSVSAEFVYLYPPGIPLITPGERLENAFIQEIEVCKKIGLRVEGMKDSCANKISVIL